MNNPNQILETSTIIANLWPLFLAMVFIIFWSARLEFKVKDCEKDNLNQKNAHLILQTKVEAEHNKISDKFDTVYEALSGIKQSLARIEERLKN